MHIHSQATLPLASLKKHSGFTLLEVLIAVAISAMIGIGATQALYSIIETKNSTEYKNQQLKSIQRFNQIVSRDVEQFINRAVKNSYGEDDPSLSLGSGDYLIEWSRAGWRNNPGNDDYRSELQRVAYQIYSIDDEFCDSAKKRLQQFEIEINDQQCLVRFFWNVIDRVSDSEPQAQVILDEIDLLEAEVLADDSTSNNQGQGVSSANFSRKNLLKEGTTWFTEWPALSAGNNTTPPSIKAMRWKLEIPAYGEMNRLWVVPDDA